MAMEPIIYWSTTHEHEASPGMVNILSVSLLDKPDLPSPRMYGTIHLYCIGENGKLL